MKIPMVKAIEHDREKRKEKLLAYFTKRRDSIQEMMKEYFDKNGEVHCCQTEVYFTYNAIISDIKNDRMES